MTSTRIALTLLLLAGGTSVAQAQRQMLPADRAGVPRWEVDPRFAGDAFTFVRLQAQDHRTWLVDFPNSDLNFPYRLHQLTSIHVNPDPITLEITDPKLKDYPLVYLVEPKTLNLSGEEVKSLRDYLTNGGFLLVDDFWGLREYAHCYQEIKKIFPDREPVELELDHPIFHAVFDLKKKPQVPAIEMALAGREKGITWEREDDRDPHYRAIFDDEGRMMVLLCYNTDLGDGWEREGESEWFFHTFSEKQAYPMGVNIVFYALTH